LSPPIASKAILIFLVSGFLTSFFLPTAYPFPQVAALTLAIDNHAITGHLFANKKSSPDIPYSISHLLLIYHI
jgi:hypothetical protein